MGVITTHGTLGATMGPPFERLYAVEPVGVLTRRPSPCAKAREHNLVTGHTQLDWCNTAQWPMKCDKHSIV
jgi:hypothetical protein